MLNRLLPPLVALLLGVTPLLAQEPATTEGPLTPGAPTTPALPSPPPSANPGGTAPQQKAGAQSGASLPPVNSFVSPTPPPAPVCRQAGAGAARLIPSTEAGIADYEGRFFWASGDYLLWWIKGSHLPPLVTTGTPAGGGALGRPGTVTLLGGDLDHGAQSGGRFDFGYWLDDRQCWSLRADFFILAEHTVSFEANSAEFPVLARPVFGLGGATVEPLASPGVATGGVTASSTSQFWGLDEAVSGNVCWGPWYRVDVLGGIRHLDLHEDLSISDSSIVAATVSPSSPLAAQAGTSSAVTDRFTTDSRFTGGEVGVSADVAWGRWVLNVQGKLALGGVKEEVNIGGVHTVTPLATAVGGGLAAPQAGGLLAQASNSGVFRRDAFGVVPELGLNVGYQLNEGLRLYAGYNVLYWSDVFRPEDQINPAFALAHAPAGTAPAGVHPVVPLRSTDFWAQGFDFGIEFRF